MKYRMIAVDLDGTLLDPNGTLNARTVRAARAAMERGATIVLSSGRMPAALKHIGDEIGVNAPAVCFNGGAVVNLQTGETMYQTTVQASMFKSAMTYEILLIVVIGGIGSITGSCISSFLFIALSEWLLRFLDNDTYIGNFHVPFLRAGFRMVVFSVIIMIIVLFFRKGIMGDKEFSVRGIYNFFHRKSKNGTNAGGDTK